MGGLFQRKGERAQLLNKLEYALHRHLHPCAAHVSLQKTEGRQKKRVWGEGGAEGGDKSEVV